MRQEIGPKRSAPEESSKALQMAGSNASYPLALSSCKRHFGDSTAYIKPEPSPPLLFCLSSSPNSQAQLHGTLPGGGTFLRDFNAKHSPHTTNHCTTIYIDKPITIFASPERPVASPPAHSRPCSGPSPSVRLGWNKYGKPKLPRPLIVRRHQPVPLAPGFGKEAGGHHRTISLPVGQLQPLALHWEMMHTLTSVFYTNSSS
ncbi:hypothetical protein MAPG_03541 [Magnaporthiopsis poae ATCC 64411]|uniref:Uncharacterized protein n=1 Tax=Magnaporthiopsis poae (strain ATCC 64411 / 73-15) TaxID=644358 RepID=A0A0C4DUA4_MAGP6|nr:hypothetical protein MAPG_03541 [Magnaporthiopsis poae ATCC 64411]